MRTYSPLWQLHGRNLLGSTCRLFCIEGETSHPFSAGISCICVPLKRTETRAIPIKGRDVNFVFAKGKDGNGKAFREVRGTFPGNDGTVLILLQIEDKAYDEDEFVKFLESIK